MTGAREQVSTLARGAVDLVTEKELLAKLERASRERRGLRVKFGWDPTGPEVHFGHCVVLRKLRAFQALGHTPVLILGDGTAMVGDPTGRQKSRPPLSDEEIERNLARYLDQVGKVLDPAGVEVVRNGSWFRAMSFADTIRLAARGTVARMIERDYFQERMKRGDPVGVHELLYPLMQGFDSVQVRADVELGATEQLFNLLVGRDLQAAEGQEPQVCLTTPVLEGTDGRKMSKTYGNAIGVLEPPGEMYGKTMSIPDRLMRSWFSLLTDRGDEEVSSLLVPGRNPREAKALLAADLVTAFHGREAASAAAAEFDRVHRDRLAPTEVPEVAIPRAKAPGGRIGIVPLLVVSGCSPSTSEARRVVAGKGVRVGESTVGGIDEEVSIPPEGIVLNVGKRRFVRIRLEP